jgi:hypothetical protein
MEKVERNAPGDVKFGAILRRNAVRFLRTTVDRNAILELNKSRH